tara:strand:- start:1060 stop:1311 length:252 start_codon:yes stop_codon:yes gene_type:complete
MTDLLSTQLLPTVLVFSVLLTLGGLLLGFMLGWVSHSYYADHATVAASRQLTHPEFYDEEGNMLTNQLLTVRFEADNEFYEDD